MNILVTGGSGFIGTHLVSDLLTKGHRVLIYDKRKSETHPDFCIVADIRDKEKLSRSMRGVEAVYHLAAEHRDDIRPVSRYYDVNVGGAQNIAYALEKNCVKKLIYTSTIAVYGLNSGESTEESPISPFNDYGWSKYKSEAVFDKWAKPEDTRCLVIVRPSAIFGERNRGNVYKLIHEIASGRFVLVGKGKNKKSMGYVGNISRFLTMLLGRAPGRHVYNYADKPDLSMEELVRIASNAFGKGTNLDFRIPYVIGVLGGYAFGLLAKITGKTYPISATRIKKFCADTRVSAEKMKETGFAAPYSLVEGLNRMISSEFPQMSTEKAVDSVLEF